MLSNSFSLYKKIKNANGKKNTHPINSGILPSLIKLPIERGLAIINIKNAILLTKERFINFPRINIVIKDITIIVINEM